MDRRVFEPRPTGNDVRRRNALSMAILVLAALGLWYFSLRANTPSAPPAPAPALERTKNSPPRTERRTDGHT